MNDAREMLELDEVLKAFGVATTQTEVGLDRRRVAITKVWDYLQSLRRTASERLAAAPESLADEIKRVDALPPTDEQIEIACAAYAKATGYYVEFHKGLRSESSDRMRRGMRAALAHPPQEPIAERETFVTHNPDGSVSLDAYAGKSRDELKDRCSELGMAIEDWQFTAVSAATDGGNALQNVREPYRSKIAQVIEGYSDDDDDECPICGGEGLVFDCFDGCCEDYMVGCDDCTRPCDCQKRQGSPELQEVLREALSVPSTDRGGK